MPQTPPTLYYTFSSSTSGIDYAGHVLVRHAADASVIGYTALLCLGRGDILGRGAVERMQHVASYDDARQLVDAFCHVMALWTHVRERCGRS